MADMERAAVHWHDRLREVEQATWEEFERAVGEGCQKCTELLARLMVRTRHPRADEARGRLSAT